MLSRYSGLDSMSQEIHPKGFNYSVYGQFFPYFPNHPSFDWSRDNYGPLIVPKSGWTRVWVKTRFLSKVHEVKVLVYFASK